MRTDHTLGRRVGGTGPVSTVTHHPPARYRFHLRQQQRELATTGATRWWSGTVTSGSSSTRRRCPGTTRCCATGDARHVRGRRSRPPATAHPDPQLPAADTTFGACRGLVAWLMSILTGTAADVLAGAVMTVVPRHGLIGAVGWLRAPGQAQMGGRRRAPPSARPAGRRAGVRPSGLTARCQGGPWRRFEGAHLAGARPTVSLTPCAYRRDRQPAW